MISAPDAAKHFLSPITQHIVRHPPTAPLSPHVSRYHLRVAATKTIAWSTHSYKPMTLKAGTLVTFKWSGYHDLAVSKLNEKSTRSEHLPSL